MIKFDIELIDNYSLKGECEAFERVDTEYRLIYMKDGIVTHMKTFEHHDIVAMKGELGEMIEAMMEQFEPEPDNDELPHISLNI